MDSGKYGHHAFGAKLDETTPLLTAFDSAGEALNALLDALADRAPSDVIGWLGWSRHILPHTFCSRLAARDVPTLSIKEGQRHQSLETTQRYMHLPSAAPREAIESLERGDVGETNSMPQENSSKN